MNICGPTGSGKTVFTAKLIENAENLCDYPPHRIIYIYSIWQPIFSTIKNVEFINHIPDNFMDQFDGSYHSWVIIDDNMEEAVSNQNIADLFTKGSHHKKISTILIKQNLFVKGKHSSTLSRNEHYTVLFNNPRDKLAIRTFATSVFPGKVKNFMALYEDITENEPYSYIFLDFNQKTKKPVRILTHIFNENGKFMRAYQL